jgi:hypothetical protein
MYVLLYTYVCIELRVPAQQHVLFQSINLTVLAIDTNKDVLEIRKKRYFDLKN